MHFHHYTLVHLDRWLQSEHSGTRIHRCFSQNRNELVIELDETFLRVGCHTPLTFIVPSDEYAKARKNVVELFPQLTGAKVLNTRVVPNERTWIWELSDGFELVFKMHGISANIILLQHGVVVQLFNSQRAEDLSYEETPGAFHPEALNQSVEHQEKAVLDALRSVSMIFEKRFAKYVLDRMDAGVSFGEAVNKTIEMAKNDSFYIAKDREKAVFYLFPPDASLPSIQVRGIVPALQMFLKCHYQMSAYRAQFKAGDKLFKKPFEKFTKVHASYQKNIDQLRSERNPEEIGHILMANLHAIEPGVKKVKLADFYQEGDITIKLDPAKSPQDNAAKYYDKHRQRKAKLTYLEDQIGELEEKLLTAEMDLIDFRTLVPPADLVLTPNGFDPEQLKAMKQVTRKLASAQREEARDKYPFRHFKKSGYDIFIGKNAKNSDELSFKFAAKTDLWLHVKDVPGSHVIIRQKPGKDLPHEVLEYAASLAAYFSKRKTDTLVPVQYTPRKFIRKRKGDPPGLVAVDREKVIMVEPLKPE
ncbi:NFACT RNA binding domain-containing protein [Pontibacter sp. G13]|uniref:NFACT RNA binding domain-containing protein n=1 Tax=Pontibacter sp. G13 TaxID=3074898 RepID=UPI0028899643|nr:NFACT RNA binding domain-containing protein [Pontibacter sp. G13]WNJ21475.1 NFACT RNA binding domain-containing protein [Pontibacter sp. G13]